MYVIARFFFVTRRHYIFFLSLKLKKLSFCADESINMRSDQIDLLTMAEGRERDRHCVPRDSPLFMRSKLLGK